MFFPPLGFCETKVNVSYIKENSFQHYNMETVNFELQDFSLNLIILL